MGYPPRDGYRMAPMDRQVRGPPTGYADGPMHRPPMVAPRVLQRNPQSPTATVDAEDLPRNPPVVTAIMSRGTVRGKLWEDPDAKTAQKPPRKKDAWEEKGENGKSGGGERIDRKERESGGRGGEKKRGGEKGGAADTDHSERPKSDRKERKDKQRPASASDAPAKREVPKRLTWEERKQQVTRHLLGLRFPVG